jgi:secreted trypsin-like serine protease
MKRVHVLSNLLLAAGLVCGLNAPALGETDTEMIVGGEPAPEGKYPWQVRLYDSMDDQIGFCGGSIIAPQWILTAAHCLVDTDKVVVGFGNIDRTKTTKIESEKIIVNPGFLEHALPSGDDVALIKLKEPIPDAKPVEYATSDTEKELMTRGVRVTVTGWGAIWDPEDKEVVELLATLDPQVDVSEKLNFPKDLYETDIHVMGRDECRSIYGPQKLNIADTEICAMKPRSVTNSCYGDSGGPLVVKAEDPKRYVQVGVVSWGDRCGRAGNPNVFARVASFSDWIKETINANGGSGAPAATMSAE